MLNINMRVNVDLKTTHYPIIFEGRNVCVHCGSEGSLRFVDKFGNETNKDIHPFDHLKCSHCGRSFSILWQTDEKSGKMFPSATEHGIGREFLNLFSQKAIKEKGEKKL